MESLGAVAKIKTNLQFASNKLIHIVHKLIFKTVSETVAENRERLKEFSGFGFADGLTDHEEHLRFVAESFFRYVI